MKVELKINLDTLVAANMLLQEIYKLPVSTDKRENIYKSIGYDLADKFDSKAKSKVRSANMFDQNKLFKITIKFHEAWALNEIFLELRSHLQNEYQGNLIDKLISRLDQKLA